jgi:hypothetical protein
VAFANTGSGGPAITVAPIAEYFSYRGASRRCRRKGVS